MITLDGSTYSSLLTNVADPQVQFRNEARGLTGLPIFLTTGLLGRNPAFTLVCTLAQVATLKTSYAKTTLLDFTDESGVAWLVAAGSNDPTHIYSTGVMFDSSVVLDPKPMAPVGWTSGNRYSVQIKLVINSSA